MQYNINICIIKYKVLFIIIIRIKHYVLLLLIIVKFNNINKSRN